MEKQIGGKVTIGGNFFWQMENGLSYTYLTVVLYSTRDQGSGRVDTVQVIYFTIVKTLSTLASRDVLFHSQKRSTVTRGYTTIVHRTTIVVLQHAYFNLLIN